MALRQSHLLDRLGWIGLVGSAWLDRLGWTGNRNRSKMLGENGVSESSSMASAESYRTDAARLPSDRSSAPALQFQPIAVDAIGRRQR